MAKEVLFLVEDADEGGYIARALGYSIRTDADSRDDPKSTLRHTVQCRFEGRHQPDLSRLYAVRKEVVSA